MTTRKMVFFLHSTVGINKKTGRYKDRPIEYSGTSTDPQKRLVFKTVLAMLKQGIPVSEIANEKGLSRPTIYKIKKANDL